MSYETNNQIATTLYNAGAKMLSYLSIDQERFIREKYHILLLESVGVIPLLLFYAFETRYMIIVIVVFIYVLVTMLVRFPKIRDSPIQKWVRLYVVLFLWFMLSKLWSGPSYYSDCLWRERDEESAVIGWLLFSSVAVQTALLFAPPHVALDYLWILNYIYPAKSMVSTCSMWPMLMARGGLLILMWIYTPSPIKVRSVGLFLVTSFYGWIVFFPVWGAAVYWAPPPIKENE